MADHLSAEDRERVTLMRIDRLAALRQRADELQSELDAVCEQIERIEQHDPTD